MKRTGRGSRRIHHLILIGKSFARGAQAEPSDFSGYSRELRDVCLAFALALDLGSWRLCSGSGLINLHHCRLWFDILYWIGNARWARQRKPLLQVARDRLISVSRRRRYMFGWRLTLCHHFSSSTPPLSIIKVSCIETSSTEREAHSQPPGHAVGRVYHLLLPSNLTSTISPAH